MVSDTRVSKAICKEEYGQTGYRQKITPNNTSFSLKCGLNIHVFGVLNDSQDLIGFASRKWYVRLTSFTVQNQLSMISVAFVCYDIAYLVKTILFHVNSFNCLTCEKEKHNCRLKYTQNIKWPIWGQIFHANFHWQ